MFSRMLKKMERVTLSKEPSKWLKMIDQILTRSYFSCFSTLTFQTWYLSRQSSLDYGKELGSLSSSLVSFILLCPTFIYQQKLSHTIVIDCGTGFYNTGQCLFHDSILIYRIIVALKHTSNTKWQTSHIHIGIFLISPKLKVKVISKLLAIILT